MLSTVKNMPKQHCIEVLVNQKPTNNTDTHYNKIINKSNQIKKGAHKIKFLIIFTLEGVLRRIIFGHQIIFTKLSMYMWTGLKQYMYSTVFSPGKWELGLAI